MADSVNISMIEADFDFAQVKFMTARMARKFDVMKHWDDEKKLLREHINLLRKEGCVIQ